MRRFGRRRAYKVPPHKGARTPACDRDLTACDLSLNSFHTGAGMRASACVRRLKDAQGCNRCPLPSFALQSTHAVDRARSIFAETPRSLWLFAHWKDFERCNLPSRGIRLSRQRHDHGKDKGLPRCLSSTRHSKHVAQRSKVPENGPSRRHSRACATVCARTAVSAAPRAGPCIAHDGLYTGLRKSRR